MTPLVPAALLADAVIGDPPGLWRWTGHPVTWFGAAIDAADRRLNRGRMRVWRGALAVGAVAAVFALAAAALAAGCAALPFGWVGEALVASTLLAHRSLHEHVARVADAANLARAREAVAMIVGRETAALDEPAVARAAIETLAENLSDGVVAPAFWLAVAGLPGIVVYKVINTADSMIGHRTPRHEAFGKAAARLDDALNIIPARLTALLVAMIAPRILSQSRDVIGDARGHVSPNAGWPEAAFAAALGVTLGGPRRYGARLVDGHSLNAAGRVATMDDIRRALRLSRGVGIVQFALYGVAVFLI